MRSSSPFSPYNPSLSSPRILGLFFLLCVSFFVSGYSRVGEDVLSDTAQEAHARALFKELRCVVCAGESIADSNADLARVMRHVVREKIQAGESDAAILDFFVERYGESVRLRPSVSEHTMVIWCVPFLVLLLGGWWMVRNRKDEA